MDLVWFSPQHQNVVSTCDCLYVPLNMPPEGLDYPIRNSTTSSLFVKVFKLYLLFLVPKSKDKYFVKKKGIL